MKAKAPLSPEARKAKYQYNKKYQDAYWERRAQREAEQAAAEVITPIASPLAEEITPTVILPQTIEIKISMPELVIPDNVAFSRDNRTDEQYIQALESSNRSMAGENRRLVQLLRKYQEVIKQGIANIVSNPQMLELV